MAGTSLTEADRWGLGLVFALRFELEGEVEDEGDNGASSCISSRRGESDFVDPVEEPVWASFDANVDFDVDDSVNAGVVAEADIVDRDEEDEARLANDPRPSFLDLGEFVVEVGFVNVVEEVVKGLRVLRGEFLVIRRSWNESESSSFSLSRFRFVSSRLGVVVRLEIVVGGMVVDGRTRSSCSEVEPIKDFPLRPI
jgi:hypothetical protein